MGVQELVLHLKLEQGLSAEAIVMLLMSQAPTLSRLNMRHDAVPRHYLGALGSLRSLTKLWVRNLPANAWKPNRQGQDQGGAFTPLWLVQVWIMVGMQAWVPGTDTHDAIFASVKALPHLEMLSVKSCPKETVADAASLPALDALNTLVAPCLKTLDIDVRLPPHQVLCLHFDLLRTCYGSGPNLLLLPVLTLAAEL